MTDSIQTACSGNLSRGETREARQALVAKFTAEYPPVRKIKIHHTYNFFIARAKYGRRSLYAKSYSLSRLEEYFHKEYHEKIECN